MLRAEAHSVPELLLEVQLNGQPRSEVIAVRQDHDGHLLVRRADLVNLGIRLPDAAAGTGRVMEQWIRLVDIPGLRAQLDFARQRLGLTASAQRLPATEIALLDSSTDPPLPSTPGFLLRYDLYGAYDNARTYAASQLGIGAFAGAWSMDSSWLVRSDASSAATRLETSISRDWPEHLTSLRIGDSISAPGNWGRSVRMGGLHWGTDFGTQPGLITFPLPAMRGEAVVPSTADVYVNGTLRARRNIEPGEFSLRDLPVVTGAGNVQVVVRDALGREQAISQSYFASEELLRPGLTAYSLDIGAIREDYGIEDSRYGRAFGSAELRRGLTEALTMAVRAESASDLSVGGVNVTTGFASGLLLSAAVVGSDDGQRTGNLFQFGIDRAMGPLSSGFRLRRASKTFQQLGAPAGREREKNSADLYLGFGAGRAGNVGIVYAMRETHAGTRVRMLSASHGVTVRALGFLSTSFNLDNDGNSLVWMGLTRPIGERTSSRLAISHDESNGSSMAAGVASSLPTGEGTAFHLDVEQGEAAALSAGIQTQRSALSLSADGRFVPGASRVGAGAAGALLFVGKHVAAVRDADRERSFALVEIPDAAHIPIYRDNHKAAQTDARGFAVIPGLRPFDANRLRVDPIDLPLDVRLDGSEVKVTPYRRGAVRVRFSAEVGGAMVRLVTETYGPVPAGAIVSVEARRFPVAGGGAVYLEGVTGDVLLEATWSSRRCRARLTIPRDDVLPDLGSVACREVL
jgi:outer membrane usher protein